MTKYGLKEIWIPENRYLEKNDHYQPKCNIFMSPDFISNSDDPEKNALVLIQGTGAVRAG